MADIRADKSQKILDTLRMSIESFKNLLFAVEDEPTRQNILRAIILFSCSGIDAIVKQLVMESLASVIERDVGAQAQFREFSRRKLKRDADNNYAMLAELLTARNSRKLLIETLKQELTINSLQNSEQIFKVASHFNISTDKLISKDKKPVLDEAFRIRNIIVHQMDVDLKQNEIKYFEHDIDEVTRLVEIIVIVAQNFIDEVNNTLRKDITNDYTPLIAVENETLIIEDFLSSL